jgi:hypothetical protein
MNEEVWKDVVGYEGYYEVSDMGSVRRKGKSKNLYKYIHRDGYEKVSLSVNCNLKSFTVHRLVASAFIDNPKQKEQVNHINGIKTDNKASNLEWATRSENSIHAIKTGLWDYSSRTGMGNFSSKIDDFSANDIRTNCVKGGLSRKHFAEKYGVSVSLIGYIVTGKRWRERQIATASATAATRTND